MSETTAADHNPPKQWVLRHDRRIVRFFVPPFILAPHARPIEAHVDFDADAVDELIAHLVDLRQHMLPPPRRN